MEEWDDPILNDIYAWNTCFCFAYGSPKKDSNRTIKITNKTGKNTDLVPFSRVAGVAYIQPYLAGYTKNEDGVLTESILTINNFEFRGTKSKKNKKTYLSPTDVFDEAFIKTSWQCYGDDVDNYKKIFPTFYGKRFCYPLEREGDEYIFNPELWVYDFKNYLHHDKNPETQEAGLQYINPCKSYAKNYNTYTLNRLDPRHIIYSPELCIKDNSGNNLDAVNPLKDTDYEVICHYGCHNNRFDFYWWGSLNSFTRTVNDEPVTWAKENK